MGQEEAAHAASKDGTGDGLSDHPQAVYTPPPTLDKALADLSLVEVDGNAPKRVGDYQAASGAVRCECNRARCRVER